MRGWRCHSWLEWGGRLKTSDYAEFASTGQAGAIVERTGCELWMHPKYEHMSSEQQDPAAGSGEVVRSRAARRTGAHNDCIPVVHGQT